MLELDLGGRVNDGTGAVLALIVGVVCLMSGPTFYFDIPGFEQGSSATQEIFVSALLSIWAIFLLWIASRNIWRLTYKHPDAILSEDGVTLHPVLSGKTLAWKDVRGSRAKRVDMGRYGTFWALEMDLTKPIASFAHPWPSKKISLLSRDQGRIRNAARVARSHRMQSGWAK